MKQRLLQLILIGMIAFSTTNMFAQQKPDKMPVYPGCKQTEKPMTCMREKILNFIEENFKTKLLHEINDAEQVTLLVNFVINEEGKIENVVVQSDYSKLNVEMERVINLLPIIKPAKIEEIPVNMQYNLPVVFDLKY